MSWSGGKLFPNPRHRNTNTRSSVGQCCYSENLACFPWKLTTNQRTNILTIKECPASSLRPQRCNTPFGDLNRRIFTPQRMGLWSCAKVGRTVCYGRRRGTESRRLLCISPQTTFHSMTSGVQSRSQTSWITHKHTHQTRRVREITKSVY